MTTATFDAVCSIPSRISELELLISNARKSVEVDEALNNALCRACCVLIASHLEGFLKDFTKGLLSDLNYNLKSFQNMPMAMKRTFCRKIAFYEGVPTTDIEKRIKQLIAFFDTHSVTIDLDSFTYKENPNRNPNASFIDAMFERFGINCIVSSLAIPSLEVVFSNDRAGNYLLRRDLKRYRSRLYHYPFAGVEEKYAFARIKKNEFVETLWHSYVEEIMTRRHSIAHGDIAGNDITWELLSDDVAKLHVLMHGVAYSAAAYFSAK